MSDANVAVLATAWAIAQITAISFGFAWWAAQRALGKAELERDALWDELYRSDCRETGETP